MGTRTLKWDGRIFDTIVSSIQIAKVPLCLFVGGSCLFGSVYASRAFQALSFLTAISVFLLACGGASINSYQERHLDAKMMRTRNRPLVHGRIPARHALFQGILLISIALLSIFTFCGWQAFLVSVLAIVLYNFVYTPLKARTLYAILPGAICGALPPYIGWLAAGGEVFSYRASLPVMLLFFWQIPHFLLVILHHREDYLKDILPNLLSKLSDTALHRIFLPWVAALATTMITFSVMPDGGPAALKLLIVINSLLMVAVFIHQLLLAGGPNYRLLFRYLNSAILCHMVLAAIEMVAAA